MVFTGLNGVARHGTEGKTDQRKEREERGCKKEEGVEGRGRKREEERGRKKEEGGRGQKEEGRTKRKRKRRREEKQEDLLSMWVSL